MALTQQSDGTSYQKPIGNKNKGNGSKKQPTIPLPNMKQQTGQGAGAQLGKTGNMQSPYGAMQQDMNRVVSGGRPITPMGNNYNGSLFQSPYSKMMQGANDIIPMGRSEVPLWMQNSLAFNDPSRAMMADSARWNAIGEDYGYDMRDLIDSRLGGGNNSLIDDAQSGWLPDNFQFLYPEGYPGVLDDEEQGGAGGDGYNGYGGYGGGYGSYIPMPSYDTWGGGGYGNNNGYRDSGLVNWRI